ncbi:MAG: YtxH domain-containing protein, partial [Gemmatimonadota bacterium]
EFTLDEDLVDEPAGAEHGKRNFLVGMALGALLGAGVALLFAPDRGANTRKRLGRRIRQLRDRSGGSVLDLKDRLSREYRRLRKRVG